MDAPLPRAPAGIRLLRGGPLLRLRSDEQLLALFRAGSDEAFQVIHDRYRQRLFTYARQMLGGSPSDAEDAMQDVFLRAYGALRADDRPVSVRAWLYRVAHNRCIDQLRRPRPTTVELHEEIAASTLHDPLTEASRREDLQRLVTDVGRLPEQQRSALLLREMEGLTYVELADTLDCSIPAVKSLLVRARMGLVEQAEARALSCSDIRDDLDQAHDRGVRMTGRARRHLRDCAACRSYRDTLKGVSTGLHSLAPSAGPWGLLAKILGIGSAGSGAAAGGAATVGAGAGAGGSVALIGGGAATASKVAAIVCCAAVVGGGAAEVQERIVPKHKQEQRAKQAKAPTAVAAAATAPAAANHGLDRTGPRPELAGSAPASAKKKAKTKAKAKDTALTRVASTEEALPAGAPVPVDSPAAHGLIPPHSQPTVGEQTGGTQAPDEPVATPTPAPTSGSGTPTTTGSGTTPTSTGSTPSSGSTGTSPSGSTGSGSGQTPEPPRDTGAPAGAAAPASGAGGAGTPASSVPTRP